MLTVLHCLIYVRRIWAASNRKFSLLIMFHLLLLQQGKHLFHEDAKSGFNVRSSVDLGL